MIIKLINYYLSICYWSHQPVEKVRAMQLRKFKEIFEYAREHSKFYHELYKKAGVLDLEIKTWDDVEKVPFVTKEMLRASSGEDVMTCSYDSRLHNVHTTSGSSGTPLRVIYSKFVDYTGHIRFLWLIMRHGYNPFRKISWLTRFNADSKFEVEKDLGIAKVLQKFLCLFRYYVISVNEPVDVQVMKLKKQKPYMLWSTPSAAQVLAGEFERQNERMKIPLIVLMSEPVSEAQANLFARVFGGRVVNHYGSMELPTMGYGCGACQSKELIPSFVMAEVVNRRHASDRDVGDLVVTNLLNREMPFIRYSIGDYVDLMDVHDFPTLKIGRVEGRSDDIVTTLAGETIFHHKFYSAFGACIKGADQYKLYQRKNGHLEFWVRATGELSRVEVEKMILKDWEAAFPNVAVRVVFKDELGVDPKTGKFKNIEKEK